MPQEFKGLSSMGSAMKATNSDDVVRGRVELTDEDMRQQLNVKRSSRANGANVIKLGNNGKGLFIDLAGGETIGVPGLNSFARQMMSGQDKMSLGDDGDNKSVTKQTVRALREICNAGL
jgi:hypothetical protein